MAYSKFIKHHSDVESYYNRDDQNDELYDHYTLTATGNQRPLRVDKFLSNLLPFTTRSKIKNASQTGSITVNGQPVKVSYKVRPNDEVKIMLPYPPAPKLEPEEMELDIRYEDEAMMIVHKPAAMVVHPSFGHRTGTLIHGLLWHFEHLPQPKGEEIARPGLVHRLDKDTTGTMVIAKTEYAMAHLGKQFFDRTSDRTYQAIVWGDVKEDEGTITGHIGRDPRDRKLFMTYPNGEVGKHAVTHYRVLERFGVTTLIECKLETGRTHQIRVHFKHIGHTLFGDKNYGGDKQLKGPKVKKFQQFLQNCFTILPRQALHAKTLAITHPTTEERMAFDSELPPDMQEVIEKMRTWAKYVGERK